MGMTQGNDPGEWLNGIDPKNSPRKRTPFPGSMPAVRTETRVKAIPEQSGCRLEQIESSKTSVQSLKTVPTQILWDLKSPHRRSIDDRIDPPPFESAPIDRGFQPCSLSWDPLFQSRKIDPLVRYPGIPWSRSLPKSPFCRRAQFTEKPSFPKSPVSRRASIPSCRIARRTVRFSLTNPICGPFVEEPQKLRDRDKRKDSRSSSAAVLSLKITIKLFPKLHGCLGLL